MNIGTNLIVGESTSPDGTVVLYPLTPERVAQLKQNAAIASAYDGWSPTASPPTPAEVLALLKAVGL